MCVIGVLKRHRISAEMGKTSRGSMPTALSPSLSVNDIALVDVGD